MGRGTWWKTLALRFICAGCVCGNPKRHWSFVLRRGIACWRTLSMRPVWKECRPLSSGIHALKGDAPVATNAPAPRGRPNATEIKDALATLAAATTTSASPVPVNATSSSKSHPSLPVVVFMDCDEESLSEYQCQLRKQIELFEA